MGKIDPKVFFANERTYLHWLNTSVTIGSIGSALLGLSGVASAHTEEGGFSAVRSIGLLMIGIAILFTAYAMFQYNRRARLLKKRSGTGYDDSYAPVALSFILVIALGAIYSTYIMQSSSETVETMP